MIKITEKADVVKLPCLEKAQSSFITQSSPSIGKVKFHLLF